MFVYVWIDQSDLSVTNRINKYTFCDRMMAGNMPAYFTREQVRKHDNESSCWVILEGRVFDVSQFILDHPGGAETLLEYAGQDISSIFHDADIHAHSQVATSILESYLIGHIIVAEESIVTEESIITKKGNVAVDGGFLDLERPLIWQMLMERKFKKRYYLEQVHIGRYLNRSARLFGWPWLELFTKTPWWVIPAFWFPVLSYLGGEALQRYSPELTLLLYCLGIFSWTLLEYVFHRFLFHIGEAWLPENQVALTLHFLLHGVHHFLPMDRYRLVMPPALFSALTLFVWGCLWMTGLPYGVRCGLVSGALTGYIAYDLLHYSFHHARMPTQTLKWLKAYHLRHHYEDDSKGFGVSSPLWDMVFGTGF